MSAPPGDSGEGRYSNPTGNAILAVHQRLDALALVMFEALRALPPAAREASAPHPVVAEFAAKVAGASLAVEEGAAAVLEEHERSPWGDAAFEEARAAHEAARLDLLEANRDFTEAQDLVTAIMEDVCYRGPLNLEAIGDARVRKFLDRDAPTPEGEEPLRKDW
mmetsp:Transcript_29576/g.88431  ORF Transcript_29576/g.88431 Transcript_29576/m.88431 type:complete len:164 (-) Transcript_29576:20-511(-)